MSSLKEIMLSICVAEGQGLDAELEKLLSQPDLVRMKKSIGNNQKKQFEYLDTVLTMFETEFYQIMKKYNLDYDELAKKILE